MSNNQEPETLSDKLTKIAEREEKSFLGFFIRHHRFTYLILIAIVLLGFYSIFTLPREANPEVKIPFAVVRTIFPGGTPTDVEELVTDKIEEKIKNLENLKRYTSVSGSGFSSVTVEFRAEADLDQSIRKLKDAVDEAKPNLPEQAEDPVVIEIQANDIPIVTYSLVGNCSEIDLNECAENLQEKFEAIADVSKVEVLGGTEREFQVIVDQTKLVNFKVSLNQIVGTIARANINLPAGDIEIDGFDYNVRVEGKFLNVKQLENIVVATYNDSPVFVKDIAEVKDTFKEKKSESRLGFADEPARNTISLQVYKSTGGNILDIVNETQDVINELKADGSIPANLTIIKTNDNSVFIKKDLRTLGTSGLQTMILIVLLLFIVLGLGEAVITGFSVPFAFLMAFIFLLWQGSTLNSMVLFSLVLSLGLMVDNSIIIMEGINEYMDVHNKKPYQAALLSVWNFKWPVISGTMTTVAAFLPMLLVSGILGEYLSILPKTITATLVSSLFVALVILPTIAARKIKDDNSNGEKLEKKSTHHAERFERIFSKLRIRYAKLMNNILPVKKKRRWVVAIAWFLFLLSVSVPATGLMKIEMFPSVDVDYFVINMELPVGTSLEQTSLKVQEVEKIVTGIPELDNYVATIGSSISTGFGSGGSGSHLANIIVNLKDQKERDRKSFEISSSLRPEFDKVQGAKVTLEEISAGPPTGSPIEVRLYGQDLEKLAQTADKVKTILASNEGVINLKDSLQDSTGEFTFRIDAQQANYYGMDIASIAGTLRNAVYGTTASAVNLDGNDVDITVKYDKGQLENINDLENILLTTNQGETIPLRQIARLTLDPSLLNISHRDGSRVVTVTADLEAEASLQGVLNNFEEKVKDIKDDDVSIEVGGEVEDIQQSYRETFLSMIVAVLLIAFILVLQFNSFRQPFIIIFTLPLAIIGVIVGLNILRLPFSFPAFIGIVALAGIVVNDAIVLIDRINKNLAEGMDFISGIVDGGLSRMQPIFLTSVTTIAGIFPLLFADELWRGLGISVIFGLAFSTVLTLVVIPVVYMGMCKKEKCFERKPS